MEGHKNNQIQEALCVHILGCGTYMLHEGLWSTAELSFLLHQET